MQHAPFALFAQVRTALGKQFGVVGEAFGKVGGIEPLRTDLRIAFFEHVAPAQITALGEFVVESDDAVLRCPNEAYEVARRVAHVVAAAVPIAAPSAVHVPRRDANLLGVSGAGLVVIEEEHVFAVVVGGEHEFDEKEIVVHDGAVEIFAEIIVELILGGSSHKVDGIPKRCPVNGFCFVVGIFHLIAAPRFFTCRVVVGGGRSSGVVAGILVMPHKDFVGPVGGLIERAMDLLLGGVGLGGVFHKLELLAVHLLGHAVETVVIAVEQHLDEAAARARAGFLLQGLMVRRGGEVVPKVGADAVAHTGTVDGHSVENPVVVVA